VIQLSYVNAFPSIWEYHNAFQLGSIPWEAVLGPQCPICGGRADFRPIPPYQRLAATLIPYRREWIEVARFQCRSTGRTFSLLPCQLVPYHRYTVDSMLVALLLAAELRTPGGSGLTRAATALPADAGVSPWLLCCWLRLAVRGLRRAHAVLRQGHDLSDVRSGTDREGQLTEITRYVAAFAQRGRGPPGPRAVGRLLKHYQHRSGHFLLGTASQQRGSQCA